MSRAHLLARIWAPIGNLLLLPLYELYVAWLAGGCLADRAPSAVTRGDAVST